MILYKDPQKLKARLQDLKKIKIHGMKFVIRRINPLLDFPSDEMPQLFSDMMIQRKEEPEKPKTPQELIRIQNDVFSVVEAGVVEPKLVPIGKDDKRGKEDGITVEDLYRDPDIGTRLYAEILDHSFNRFRGIRKIFFSLKTKYSLFMAQRKNMGNSPLISSSPTETRA